LIAPLSLSLPRKLMLVTAIVLLMAAFWLVMRQLGLPDNLSPGHLAEWLSGSGAWGPVLLMTLMVLAVVVSPIPTLPISAASGLAFGVLGGTLIAAVGATLGALVAFWTSRLLARDATRRKFQENPFFAEQAPQGVLFWGIFMTRLIPLFSFALISYVAGLTAVSAWRFLLASFIGMLPMTFVFAGLGHSLQIHPVLTVAAGGLILLVMVVAPYHLRNHPVLRRWLTVEKKEGS